MPSEHEGSGPSGPIYRIRWAHVVGPWEGKRRMCLAEKFHLLLGFIPFWWPTEGNWRYSEEEAHKDIENDIRLYEDPLPRTKLVSY